MTKINDITRLNKCNPTDSLKWKESVNNDCQQFHLQGYINKMNISPQIISYTIVTKNNMIYANWNTGPGLEQAQK